MKYVLVFLLALFLAGCGSKKEKQAATKQSESATTEQQAPVTTAPAGPHKFSDDAYEVTPSGLQYVIIEKTNGAQPQKGDFVVVHYTGWLTDGTKFDSSYDRGEPITFQLGTGQVIPGWDEGIALLHKGEKAQLVIPPDLAYGSRGVGPIPPNATLIFEVQLIDIKSSQQ